MCTNYLGFLTNKKNNPVNDKRNLFSSLESTVSDSKYFTFQSRHQYKFIFYVNKTKKRKVKRNTFYFNSYK